MTKMRKVGLPFFLLSVCSIFLVLTFCGCQKKEKGKELVIWHWMADRQSAFEELAKKYEELAGVKVKFELFFPPDAYAQKIQAAAAANDLPDIFGILGDKKIFASFVRGGYIENLTPYMNDNNGEWKNRFVKITLDFNSFKKGNVYGVEEGIYAVPIDTMSIQFLYNKELLKEAGFTEDQYPKNWQEFIEIAKKVSEAKKVYGFVCGWGEPWFIYCLVTNYAFNVMGEDKFFATMRGEVPYTDPAWIKIFKLFKDLREANILAPGIITMSNKEAEQFFAMGKALFSFNGSWGMNTYFQINPNLNYDTMLPPKVEDSNNPVRIWVGAGSSFVVNKKSPLKEEAIKFLKWLTEKEQQAFLVKKTRNLPSVKGCDEFLDESLLKFLKHTEFGTHPNLWPINENPRVIETINTGIQKIIIGEATPEQVAEEVEKAKQMALKER